jgi:Leucine-rich repeat (LRR) protein
MQNQIFIPRNEESHKNKTTPIMKKLFYILLLITGITNAQIVDIPDANFKAKLIELGVDTNADGNIQQSEALAVTSLNIPVSNIADLTGIQAFVNLTNLECSQNQLSTLDLSSLTNLTDLQCTYNQLTSLNITGLTNLQLLYCNNNLLASLDLDGLTNLNSLGCGINQLTSLDLSTNTSLTQLSCNFNQLTNLDLTNNVLLTFLDCSANPLGTLDVSNNVNLISLHCHNNNLTALDLSNNVNLDILNFSSNGLTNIDLSNNILLTRFGCSTNSMTQLDVTPLPNLIELGCSNNQLTTLDLSNSHNLFYFSAENNLFTNLDFSQLTDVNSAMFNMSIYIQSNPNLQNINLKNGFHGIIYFSTNGCPNLNFVCADDFNLSQIQSSLNTNGNNNVVLNSYCFFEPGGDYNTITGSIKFDGNSNGCDATDLPQPNGRVNINDGTNQGATFTNTTGNYNFYTQAGSFVLTPAIENPTWFTFSPTTATIPFADNNNNTATQNFCLSANGIHPDVEIVIAPITPARPGFDATYKIVYKNKGNQTLSGNVTFSYVDAVLDFVSATVVPNSQSVGTMSWNYTNLLPFESRSIEIVLNVNAPTETPAVNIGDQLDFNATITPIASDEIPADNVFLLKQIVVGSYDPNDITCLEGDIVSPSEIGNYLHYNIRFENTGTAAAEFVVVKVEVNETDFDMNSLQIMNSSDPVYTRINQNIVEFIFQNIQLETGGHGNILLKIKSKNNLQVGDEVNKKANIYFDYNFPILTNDAETVFQSLNNPDFQNDASISVYPNPTNGIVTVNCNNSIKSVQLYDVQGRLLQTNLVNENETTIDVSTKSKGVYFLKILSDKGMKVEKIVRE